MPFGLCNAPATFEKLMDRVLSGMRWSRCLVYLDDMISFGADAPEALAQLTEVLKWFDQFRITTEGKEVHIYADGGGFLGTYRRSSRFGL